MDLTIISSWICKNLFLDQFLRKKLKDDSLLIKIHNYYIKKTLEKIIKDNKNWIDFDNFFYEIKDVFKTLYEKFWGESYPKVEYGYFFEKIDSDYIVILEYMNYWEDELKRKYSLPQEINPNPSIEINPTFFEDNRNSDVARRIYISYINFFSFLIKKFIRDKNLLKELQLTFNSEDIFENIETNWLMYELIVYILVSEVK